MFLNHALHGSLWVTFLDQAFRRLPVIDVFCIRPFIAPHEWRFGSVSDVKKKCLEIGENKNVSRPQCLHSLKIWPGPQPTWLPLPQLALLIYPDTISVAPAFTMLLQPRWLIFNDWFIWNQRTKGLGILSITWGQSAQLWAWWLPQLSKGAEREMHCGFHIYTTKIGQCSFELRLCSNIISANFGGFQTPLPALPPCQQYSAIA